MTFMQSPCLPTSGRRWQSEAYPRSTCFAAPSDAGFATTTVTYSGGGKAKKGKKGNDGADAEADESGED